jgi:hypothetical protein
LLVVVEEFVSPVTIVPKQWMDVVVVLVQLLLVVETVETVVDVGDLDLLGVDLDWVVDHHKIMLNLVIIQARVKVDVEVETVGLMGH